MTEAEAGYHGGSGRRRVDPGQGVADSAPANLNAQVEEVSPPGTLANVKSIHPAARPTKL